MVTTLDIIKSKYHQFHSFSVNEHHSTHHELVGEKEFVSAIAVKSLIPTSLPLFRLLTWVPFFLKTLHRRTVNDHQNSPIHLYRISI